MTSAFKDRQGKVEDHALEFANRLLWITGRCRPDMHEPGEAGIRKINLVGDHLDNAMGEDISASAIAKGYQEFVLIIDRESGPGHDAARMPFNLATLIAFARIGAEMVRLEAAKAEAWNEPQIPGDAVRQVMMKKGREVGDIRIQDYSAQHKGKPGGKTAIRVASFLPGRHVFHEGDTPKTEPENSKWVDSREDANAAFSQFVEAALADGWVEFNAPGKG